MMHGRKKHQIGINIFLCSDVGKILLKLVQPFYLHPT